MLFALKQLYDDYTSWPGWYEGPDELQEASLRAQETNNPLMVYIYTDRCGWCAKLEADLLSTEQFDFAATDIVKIKLRAQGDRQVSAFMEQQKLYGVPQVLVRKANSENYRKIPTFKKINGNTVTLSSDEFLKAVHQAL